MDRIRVPAALALVLLIAVSAVHADPLREEVLLSKHRRGDYAFYVSWHDPWGAAFDEHGSFAWPIGGKVRFRLGPRYRVEIDFSYYQQGGQVQPFISTAITPGFDGVMVGATGQAFLKTSGPLRPYVGGGPMFVSLSNDTNIEFRNIPDDVLVAERFQIATWTQLDLGLQAVLGVDVPLGQRAFPFVEYRHLFGELSIEPLTVGLSEVDPAAVKLLDGSPVDPTYDWSGPNVLLGLKVLF